MRKVWQDTNDSCLRAAVAMVLDRDYRDVPYFSPAFPSFWNRWMEWWVLEEKLVLDIRSYPGPSEAFEGPWIAAVPARGKAPTALHSVVMEDARLFHDPSTDITRRKAAPRKIILGIKLEQRA